MTEEQEKWEHGIMRYAEIMKQKSVNAVLHERCDQILKHEYDAEHDDDHRCSELATAAAAVLQSYDGHSDLGREIWPWFDAERGPLAPLSVAFNNITQKTPFDKLAVAAALILAEMDRLDRIEKAEG